jgi:hypothetical protein
VRLEEVEVRLPPLFAEACGYRGSARYVALCWVPEKQELWCADSDEATLGETRAFKMLCEHEATGAALVPFLEAVETALPRPWLLIDRARRTLSFGNPTEIWKVTAGQHLEARQDGRRFGGAHWQRQLEREVQAWLDWMAKRGS